MMDPRVFIKGRGGEKKEDPSQFARLYLLCMCVRESRDQGSRNYFSFNKEMYARRQVGL